MIKKACWWLLGLVALAGIVLLFAQPPDGRLFDIGVVSRTNSATGERVTIAVTNRSNRELIVVATPMVKVWKHWGTVRDFQLSGVLTNVGVNVITAAVPGGTNGTLEIPFPREATGLRVKYSVWDEPGVVRIVLRWCLELARRREPGKADFEGTLELDP